MKPTIFITGTQRSGTTLLCRILSAHPDMFVFNELYSGEELDTIIPRSQAGDRLFNLLKDKKISLPTNCRKWGVKDPYLTNHLESLHHNFPESKIIITLRDGRAVGSSYLKTGWGMVNIYSGAIRWKKEVTDQKEFIKKHPDHVYLVKFESLLQSPQEEIRKICDFLEIEFQESMLNYHKKPLEFSENKSNVNTKKPIDSKIQHKWKKNLTPYQISVFETIAGDLLEESGYKCVGKPVQMAPLTEWGFKTHQAVVGEIQLQYQWRIKGWLKRVGWI